VKPLPETKKGRVAQYFARPVVEAIPKKTKKKTENFLGKICGNEGIAQEGHRFAINFCWQTKNN
jgi:hypothetical protein